MSVKFAYIAISVWRGFSCMPLHDPLFEYILQLASSIIYATFMPTYVFMIALGIGVTTVVLPRRKLANVLIVTVISYLMASTYYVFGPSFEFIIPYVRGVLVFYYAGMSAIILYFVTLNLQQIQRLSAQIIAENMIEIKNALKTKYRMYLIFGPLISTYFALLGILQFVLIIYEPPFRILQTVDGFNSFVIVIIIGLLCTIFHPQYFTSAFEISVSLNSQVFFYKITKIEYKFCGTNIKNIRMERNRFNKFSKEI